MFLGFSYKFNYKLVIFLGTLLSLTFASTPLIADSNVIIARVNAKTNKEKPQEKEAYVPSPTLAESKVNQARNHFFLPQNKYQPYFELGGARYFNKWGGVSGVCDLFIPLLQKDGQLLFADIRIFGRNSGSSEGNLHLGYRKLYPTTKQLFGIYAALDCKKSIEGSVFNQLTLGFEYWNNRWFVGGNLYKPVGKTTAFIERKQKPQKQEFGGLIITETAIDKYYERALPGVDAELGYAITDRLTSYVGGYYFAAKDIKTIVGPKIRLTYDYQKTTGRILGVLDGISIEAGAQHDKTRNNSVYIGIKFKVGLTNFKKNSNIYGFERHMVEPVRRDPDIIVGQTRVERELSKIELVKKSPGNELVAKTSEIDVENKVSLKELLKKFGLPENTTLEDVKKKHRQYALLYHPDKRTGDQDLFIYYQALFEEIEKVFSNDSFIKSPFTFASSYSPKTNDVKSDGGFLSNEVAIFSEKNNKKHNVLFEYLTESLEKKSTEIINTTKEFIDTLQQTKQLDPHDIVIKQYAENRTDKTEDLINRLNAVDNNSVELSEGSISYLERIIMEDKEPRVLRSIAWALTGCVINYPKNPSHITFLVELAKNVNIDSVVRENIVNRFAKNIYESRQWSDNKAFDSFAALLPYDVGHHNLVDALVKANKEFGYTASIEALPYFENLLDDPEVKENILVVIANSLEKLLISGSNSTFAEVQKHLDSLLDKVRELPSGLVNTVFEIYSNDQSYFTNAVVNILAVHKYLSSDSLHNLIAPLTQIKDPKIALFMALRLVQNHIVLPVETLRYFIRFLSSEDEAVHLSTIKLYRQLNKKTPMEVRLDLIDALIAALPKVDNWSRFNIDNLLNIFELNQEQKLRRDTQAQGDFSEFDVQLYRELLNNLVANIEKESELSTSDKNELTRSVGRLINQVKWPADFLFGLIKDTDQKDVSALITVLELLNDYTVAPKMINRRGETAQMILKEKSSAEMLSAIKYLIEDNSFFVELDVTSFIEELKELNKNNPEMLALIESRYFEDQLSKIENIKNNQLKISGVSKSLSEWTEDDFSKWQQNLVVIDDNNIAEVMAVFSQAVHNAVFNKKYYPRQIQLVAFLVLFKSTGVLEQNATGEGKSIIIAMFALISAMRGSQVDVVTSSPVLAKRDVFKHRNFFSLFGIDAAHNVDSKRAGEARDCYKSSIVYGDIVNFNGDALRDDSTNVKYGRAFDIVIIDEVDDPLVDRYNMKVQLSKEIPGFDVLSHIFIYMWGASTNLLSMLQQKDDGCHLIMSTSTEKENEELKKIIPLEVTDGGVSQLEYIVGPNCIDYFKDTIASYTTEKLFAFGHIPESRLFVVPRNIEKTAIDQLQNWIRSILLSYQYTEGVDYIISKETIDDLLQVTLVDKRGGVIQHKLHLSDGLHQFLGIENKLALFPESFVSTFMSYPGYFKRYNNIYGVTGTLGTTIYQDFFKDVYGVTLSVIPPFVPKNLTEFPPILVDSVTELYRAIHDVVNRKIKGQRASLIVMKTIKQVKNLYKYLLNQKRDSALQMFTYGIGNEEEDEKLVERKLHPGDVIIATYLAGRGTDLQLDEEVKNNGGLHVIQTEPSESGRASDQVDGRAARQGEPGSKQLIFNREDIKEQLKIDCIGMGDNECIAKVDEERNKNEIQILKQRKEKDLPYIQILDKIYNLYLKFVSEIDAPAGYKILIGEPKGFKELTPCALYLYKDNTKIMFTDAVREAFDITELIKIIDPGAARHIDGFLSNFSDDNAIFGLNKQGREIIYFIASHKGCLKNSEVYNRIQDAFNELIKKTQSKQAYLNGLLANDSQFKGLRADDVELRKLFLLWLDDRELYNKEYLVKQLEEKFGIWLRRQVDLLFRHDSYIDIHNCEEQFNSNFLEFKNLMLAEMTANKFIENPVYLVLEAWRKLQIYYNQLQKTGNANAQELVEMVAALEKAREFEPTYSWTVDNALANLVLVKDGTGLYSYKENDEDHTLEKVYEVKKKYCEYAGYAISKIEKLIETFNAALTFLLAQKQVALTDDLAVQLTGKVAFYQQLTAKLQNNIEVVSKASMDEMVREKNILDHEKLKQEVDIKAAVLQNIKASSGMSPAGRESLSHIVNSFNFTSKEQPILNQVSDQILAQGGFIIELETYKLNKKEKSIFGTIASALMGIGFVCAGILLAPCGGVFLHSFAMSLVSKGVGDIVSALHSVVTGNLIDFGDYLNSSGMSLGISLAVSSMLFFLDKIQMIHNIGFADKLAGVAKNLKDAPMGVIGTTSLIHTSTIALSTMLGKLGNKFIDEKDIKDEAQTVIDGVINSYEEHEALKNIFITDALNGNNNLINILYNLVEKIVHDYQKWLHDDRTTFGVGVGTDVAGQLSGKFGSVGNIMGIGNLIKTGTKLAIGGIKNAKALSNIANDIRSAIKKTAEMAIKNGEMMTRVLANALGVDISDKLIGALGSPGYIQDCGSLSNVQLDESLLKYKPGIIEACISVKNLLLKEYQTSYDVFKNDIVNRITGAISSIQKQEIMQPIVDAAAIESGTRIGAGLYNYLNMRLGETVSATNYDKYWQRPSVEEAVQEAFEKIDAVDQENQRKSTVSDAPSKTDMHSDITNKFDSYFKKSAIKEAVENSWFAKQNDGKRDIGQQYSSQKRDSCCNNEQSTVSLAETMDSSFDHVFSLNRNNVDRKIVDLLKHKQSKVIWLDGKVTIDDSKLAWWVKRPVDSSASFDKRKQISNLNSMQKDQKSIAEYATLPSLGNLNTHWGIQLANKNIVGYFGDSVVHWNDKDFENYYSKYKLFGHYAIGFDDEIMEQSLRAVEKKWNKEKDERCDMIEKYSLKDHNCQHFILDGVFKEYLYNGGAFYIKPVLYNIFHLDDLNGKN